MKPIIYLDNAATSYPKPEAVYQAMNEWMRSSAANPGRSGHIMAVRAASGVLQARRALARLINAPGAERIIFTSNCTDSLNLALKGLLRSGDHVITSSMEHNSVTRPLKSLESQGVTTTRVRCSPEGLLPVEQVAAAITPRTRLIAVTHASNVTGTILPIAELGALARAHNLLLLVDGAQSVGAIPVDVQALGIDLLAFPGHKALLGPPGTGGLYIGPRVELVPVREGGTGGNSEQDVQPSVLPDRFESGTLNTVGIAGLGAGAEFLLKTGIAEVERREREVTRHLLDGLSTLSGVTLYSLRDVTRQVATVSFNLDGWEPADLGAALDDSFGIAARTGLHCAPDAHRTVGSFPVGTVRFSPGYFTTITEVDQALNAIEQLTHAVVV